ncbi:PBP1A family penicillin-binding protein [Pacificimonas sp. WHA3]|uniref:Penicillin-binding protein 1A n=1 Tax=Pacificimonas pallii TaxID=2827236 RepID=A0ABS6SED3_9SPHN|nr:PBP1A family penicillin-binding protein [Pacificimonas pallii]MBV7256620.1 PBP1A family penicillin-binding protein [Pacificimonas pallii]
MENEPESAPKSRRWLKRVLIALGGVTALGLAVLVGGYFWLASDLPDTAKLAEYEPPLPSHVRSINGEPISTFARERRIYITYPDMPAPMIQAFISAEDKTFFEHNGIDPTGFINAVMDYTLKIGSGDRAVGGSTITQQVAKNLLLSDEYSVTRKLKEMILATRIEDTFTKEEILELYLNQIFLGRNAYGVQAASFAYFDKPVTELNTREAAFLATLPKAPSNYNPSNARGLERATTRRDWILGQMGENGFLTPAEVAEARSEAIVVQNRREQLTAPSRLGDYFVEAIRRDLIDRYGEEGPNGIYTGGLWVRSTMDPDMQIAAEMAVRDALVRYDRGRGWRGATDTIELGDGWPERLRGVNLPVGYDDWRAAVVLAKNAGRLTLGFADGSEGVLVSGNAQLRDRGGAGTAYNEITAGDVIPVKNTSGNDYTLRQIPEVGGGMVVQEVSTGRVLAMVGGFDARKSSFNRATQAKRQPGSTIKPFVYAAALENGFTPASIVMDAPYCVYQSRSLGRKCFRNFSGRSAGAQTMRWGLEQSRNLMTVRLASKAGMENVVELIEEMGIGSYDPYLSFALGAGETTVMDLTNAYAMLANHGKRQAPIMYDLIQDRRGNAIYRADDRECAACNQQAYTADTRMPMPLDQRPQAMDPRTAYQVVHMLEGVVERGTAVALRRLERPMFGKTGTNNGPTNVWFVGGTQDIVAGFYMGFDQPKNMGGYAQGGTLAAPAVRQFFELALDKDHVSQPFRIAPGVRMVRVDRRSGKRVYGAWPGGGSKPAVIWEAFKPENEPRRVLAQVDNFEAANRSADSRREVRSDSEFLQQEGGIY